MRDLLARVKAALADRYAVERELGQGGMATVYLAQDLRHGRKVALKVLKPELSAVIGPERFRREIEIAARLAHPHILPLHDSGEADGLLYFVMPFVDGESLRTRLERERQLPLDDALQIARDVAAGLAYAHEHGIVHRDIKPENILLSDGEALIADFGIARVLDVSVGDGMTQPGMAIGTLAYMSPEQALGGAPVNGRSDIYSLGCVVYEMLAGQQPFVGQNPMAVISAHTAGKVPAFRVIRPGIPDGVERAVLRAMEKLPADRYATASEFAGALRHGETGAAPRATVRAALTLPRWAIPALAVIVAVLVVAYFTVPTGDRAEATIDESAIAVFPFEVTGSVDSSLISPDGLVELLYTRLSGESGGLKALYPAVVERAWHEAQASSATSIAPAEIVRLARSLGAGQALVGRVQGDASSVTMTASVLEVPSGRDLARIEVSGPLDSLFQLVDRLAARVLVGRAGERDLQSLTTNKLAALRPYLAGLQKYRRGRYRDAAQDFTRALDEDSTFALAALALVGANNVSGMQSERALQLAWARRDRLSEADRNILRAWAGPSYPASSPMAASLALWERVVDSFPERWEASYMLGEIYFHYGAVMGTASHVQRATAAFRRSLAVDSAFAPALEHLVDLAGLTGDTAELRRAGNLYLKVDSLGDNAQYIRWRMSVALGDSTERAEVRNQFHSMTGDLLARIAGAAQLDAVALDDAEAAIAELRSRPRNQGEVFLAFVLARQFLLNRGRPHQAAALRAEPRADLPVDPLFRVIEAYYWEGDTAGVDAAVRQREAILNRRGAEGHEATLFDLCTVGLWRASQPAAGPLEAVVLRLRAAIAIDPGRTMLATMCEATLQAELSARQHLPDRARALARLDSLVGTAPALTSYLPLVANLTSARLHEANGDVAAALAAVRRRQYFREQLAGLSTLLREEGRLATALGDTVGAVQAFEHYLTLRADPEPSLRPAVQDVRAHLWRLQGREM